MRNLISVLSLAAVSLLASGVAPPPRGGSKPNLAALKTIRFVCGECGGIPGAPRNEYRLELSARGPCRATVIHGNNWDNVARTTTYALPARTFEEVRKALIA